MQLGVTHACRHVAIFVGQCGRQLMILITPDETHRLRHTFHVGEILAHLRAMAGQAGGKTQALGADDGVRAAIAKARRHGAAVEARQRAEISQRIGHIRLTGLDALETRLGAFRTTRIAMRQDARDGAPEQIGGSGKHALRGKGIGQSADVLIHALHSRGDDDARRFHRGVRDGHIAVECTAVARLDFDVLLLHALLLDCVFQIKPESKGIRLAGCVAAAADRFIQRVYRRRGSACPI